MKYRCCSANFNPSFALSRILENVKAAATLKCRIAAPLQSHLLITTVAGFSNQNSRFEEFLSTPEITRKSFHCARHRREMKFSQSPFQTVLKLTRFRSSSAFTAPCKLRKHEGETLMYLF